MRGEELREGLFGAGFDICHGPFSPAIYNDLLESEGLVESGSLSKLPEEITTTANTIANKDAETNQKTEAYLIGNTKHLWPIFLRWLQLENEMKAKQQRISSSSSKIFETETSGYKILIEDPLDTYERTAIRNVVERVCGVQHQQQDETKTSNNNINNCNTNSGNSIFLYWSSDLDPLRMVSMARIASCTGFSYLDPHTHLSIHPTFGTWHSYRAVLLLPKQPIDEAISPSLLLSSSSKPRIAPVPNPLSPVDARAAKEAFGSALDTSRRIGKKATTETGATSASSTSLGQEDLSELSEELGRGKYKKEEDRKIRMKAWIGLRESISIGQETYRFDDNQLWYHYTKDKRCLIRGIKGLDLGSIS